VRSTVALEFELRFSLLCWLFPLMAELQPWQWALGALVALLTGIAKTGLPGLGILIVPLMVLTVGDARLSAGWLLPMLCTADVFAVIYYRRHAAAWRLFALTPSVIVGMIAGAFALRLKESTLRPLIGAIVLLMLVVYLWRRYRPSAAAETSAAHHPALYGASAGFATTVANAAGPVMNLYLLGKRLTKEEFVATGAWFFFAINLTKVPIYAVNRMFTPRGLLFDLWLAPVVVAGAYAGRRIVTLLSPQVFEVLVLALTVLSTLLLFR
jgi:uncharacterized membrane protein YfcA